MPRPPESQSEQTVVAKVNFETSRTQSLFAPWEGATVGLMGLLTRQWTPSILPPAEQSYLGGARFTVVTSRPGAW